MKLTPEQELENAIIKNNWFTMCKLFELTESESLHINAGEWMVDAVKQIMTTNGVLKTLKLRITENQSISGYAPTAPLPNTTDKLANILLANEKEETSA